jgi:GNAT superfamily N-acetyltransferase
LHLEHLADGTTLGVVDDLFVLPDGRGVGVGEAMMDLLLEFCATHGCTGIDAVALPGNRETKNFFETFGLVARAIVVHRDLRGRDGDDESGERS